MKNVSSIVLFILFISQSLTAQNFLEGYDRFSSKKEAYITLSNGEEIVAFIDDIKRKKGLIKQVDVKMADGKKKSFKPQDIKSMFLAPSGFDKLVKIDDKVGDLTEINKDRTLHDTYVKEGYVYFETCEVKVKKKSMYLLMQLVNPAFAGKIKVFHDPYAKESTKINVGVVTVAGGIEKSYYVKKGQNEAFRLKSGDYRKLWKEVYGTCKELDKEVGSKKDWKNFEKHVYYYDQNCM